MDYGHSDAATAKHAQRLFAFLAESSELRTRPMRTLDAARRILWFDDLPGDFPGLRTFAGGSTAAADIGSWLTLTRVDLPDPPPVPARLALWLDAAAVRDYTAERAPELRQRPADVPDDAMDEAQRVGLRQAVEDKRAPCDRCGELRLVSVSQPIRRVSTD
ncbi:hypothetical protein KGQ19_10590 [Catenulispora sp. NL8]|uniref:Uncharacterized protein n=1 Tax=Catenulispora pinistramenti TaxID=2705254 RepID=A0ABS5KMN3_9ACTN|nr:hypothetical protein [Catenulispora pinistramenti]MBS2547321.1 hypothetical protein [Catenulispora pinistramenti]